MQHNLFKLHIAHFRAIITSKYVFKPDEEEFLIVCVCVCVCNFINLTLHIMHVIIYMHDVSTNMRLVILVASLLIIYTRLDLQISSVVLYTHVTVLFRNCLQLKTSYFETWLLARFATAGTFNCSLWKGRKGSHALSPPAIPRSSALELGYSRRAR